MPADLADRGLGERGHVGEGEVGRGVGRRASRPKPGRSWRRSIQAVAGRAAWAGTWSWNRLWATCRWRAARPADLLQGQLEVARIRACSCRAAAAVITQSNVDAEALVRAGEQVRVAVRDHAQLEALVRGGPGPPTESGNGGQSPTDSEKRVASAASARCRARRRRRAAPGPGRRGRAGTDRPRRPPRTRANAPAARRRGGDAARRRGPARNAARMPVSQSISVP